ncbi:aldehyde dehydrogenase family protein [Rubritalea tangerina]|uniref:Aldehyde dehydrogenase n=1 Tax=Rubritalea tangerina TaxID=430798 RepID=A0ABW4ZE28_9BACT
MAEALSELLERQKAYFDAGHTLDVSQRLIALQALRDAICQREEVLMEAFADDLGKPEVEAYMAELVFTLQELDFTSKRLRYWCRPQRVGTPWYFLPARSWVERRPFGRVLLFGPWNYPFQLVMAPLISAVAAGNTVVVKPSEHTPATARVIGEIVEAVFDPSHVSVLHGGGELAEDLLGQDYEMVFFTGSTGVGRKVALAAASKLVPSVLELGGKCPCYVGRDADVEIAAERILLGKFMNAGQTCVAPDYVAVHKDVSAAFTEALRGKMRSGIEGWEEMAKLVHMAHYDRLLDLCDGQEVEVYGIDRPAENWMAPRIVLEAKLDSALMREEIFGPILPIVTFEDLGELPRQEGALACYIFSRDASFVRAVQRHTPSGGTCINDIMKHMTNLRLPFGGVGASGHGRYRGKWGFEAFTAAHAVTKRYFIPDPLALFPPYEGAYARLKRIFKL